MALQGTLKDFSIADIFQLIGQQGKSGSLILVADAVEAQVVFDKGSVVLARFTKGHDELKLGTLLMRSGLVNRNQMAAAYEEHKKKMQSLGDVLLSRNVVTQEILGEIINLQTREALFRILQWKVGVYKFKAEEFHYNRQIVQPISTDFLLMDGFRQLDEWPGIMKVLGSFDGVFELTTQGRAVIADHGLQDQTTEQSAGGNDEIDAAFAAFNDDKKPEAGLEENERKLLPLINGQRSIQDLIDRSRLGTFETAFRLAEFFKRSWVTKVSGLTSLSSERLASYADAIPKRSLFLANWLPLLLVTVFIAVFILFASPLIPSIIDRKGATGLGKSLAVYPDEKYLQYYNGEQRLRRAIQLYYFENLDYPADLDQLSLKEILADREIDSFTMQQFFYKKNLDDYTLLLPPIAPLVHP